MRHDDVVWNQAIAAAIAAYKDGIGAIHALIRRPVQEVDMEVTHD